MRFIQFLVIPLLVVGGIVFIVIFNNQGRPPGEITFDKTRINLGEVPEWEGHVTSVIKAKNEGQETVKIERIESSCSCSVVNGPKQLEPGQVVPFQISFDPKAARTESMSRIQIFTDSSKTPHVILEVIAEVKPALEWSSAVCDFGVVYPNTTDRKRIQLYIHQPMDIDNIQLLPPNHTSLSCKLQYHDRNEYHLEVILSPITTKGIFSDRITLLFPNGQTFTLPVTARIVGVIQVEPESLFYGIIKQGEQPSREVTLSGQVPFQILAIKTSASITIDNPPGAETRNTFQLKFSLSSTQKPGLVQEDVRILTSIGTEPIRLPVYGMIRIKS